MQLVINDRIFHDHDSNRSSRLQLQNPSHIKPMHRKRTPISQCEMIPSSKPMLYDLGFSFFSFQRALNPTPETLTTLKRTPGISPLALPLRPKPARRTSSFSSTKLRQPSFGTVTHPSASNPPYPSARNSPSFHLHGLLIQECMGVAYRKQ